MPMHGDGGVTDMINKLKYIMLTIFIALASPCWAQQDWTLKETYETKPLIKSGRFFLFTAADVNGNGTKELILTDFGHFGDHIEEWKQWVPFPTRYYNLFILEWQNKALQVKLHKQWDMKKPQTREEEIAYFDAYRARQMVPWKVGDRVVVETIPAFLGIEWQNGIYTIHEQPGGSPQKSSFVGSWAFPWLSLPCNNYPIKWTWPMECLIGIRDFSGKKEPKILTVVENKIGFNQYRETLRIRNFSEGYPVEWEMPFPKKLGWWSTGWEPDQNDRLNMNAKYGLFIYAQGGRYYFDYDQDGKKFGLRPIQSMRGYLDTYDLPEAYLRQTQKKGAMEYWGYHRVDLDDPNSLNYIVALRKAILKPDLSGFITEDIDFPHHDHYLGVGHFDVEDIDGDGLDEIILVEQTAGKLTFGEETVYYDQIKDYIHILKWDETKYRDMWVSPPYTKRGTKFLVEDIKNVGKKQLVVLTPYGTVQIWERQ
jgi:hypothetical protein